MLEKYWISEEGWGKHSDGRPVVDGAKEVSLEDYLKHEAEQLKRLSEKPVEISKVGSVKKKSSSRKKVAPKKKLPVDSVEVKEDGS